MNKLVAAATALFALATIALALYSFICTAGDRFGNWRHRLDLGLVGLEHFRSDCHTVVGTRARYGYLPSGLHRRPRRR